MTKTTTFRLALVLSVLSLISLPLARSKPAPPAKYVGWHITQRNKIVGLIELGMCPAGCTFHTSIFNGFVRETGKEIIVTLLNAESKTFRDFSYETFTSKMAKIYTPMKAQPEGWKRVTKKKFFGGKILGYDTICYDYDLINTEPPYQKFPDQCWLCPKIRSSPRTMKWFAKLVRTPQEFDNLGLPLRVVETMDTRTKKTQVFHDTLKVAPYTFNDSDFQPPVGFKATDSDMDLFVFGP